MTAVSVHATTGATEATRSSRLHYPQKTVTIICPWSPGGGTDAVSRFWAAALEESLGKPFVVVNRTGGAGAVGHFAGAHAKPDGHTIAMITFELSTMHRMQISRLTYRDYECLLQMNADPAAIVVPADSPWQDLTQFLDAVRTRPGEIKMSGTATGGAWDLARAGLLQAAKIPIPSCIWVPHPGAAPSLAELRGGHLDAICCSVPEVAAQLKNGEVRVLAVMAEQRIAGFPELPTAREQGVDWVAVGWRGLALPKGTPPEIVELLKEECLKIAASDEFRSFMEKYGFGVRIRATDEFTAFLKGQDQQWKSVVEAAGYDRGLAAVGDFGPRAFPIAMLTIIVGVGIALRFVPPVTDAALTDSLPEMPASLDLPSTNQRRAWALGAAMVVYAAMITPLGFPLSTWLFMVLVTTRLGARPWVAAVTGAVFVAIVCLLFVQLFEVQLPGGLLR